MRGVFTPAGGNPCRSPFLPAILAARCSPVCETVNYPLPLAKNIFFKDWCPSAWVRRAQYKGGAFPVGAKPTRLLLLQPVAIGVVMEVTKWLKPLV